MPDVPTLGWRERGRGEMKKTEKSLEMENSIFVMKGIAGGVDIYISIYEK